MSKTNTFETSFLQHLFQNANIALIGDATGLRGSTAAGSLYVSLHTADPSEPGIQTTSEATFGAYARMAVARSASGWTVTGAVASNFASIVFPTCTSGTNTITHFGVGTDLTGAGTLLFKGVLSSSIAVSTGIVVQFDAGNLTITEE